MNICNKVVFGYMLNTCTENMSLEEKRIMFVDTLVDHLGKCLCLDGDSKGNNIDL